MNRTPPQYRYRILLVVALFSTALLAHGGKTRSDGCHTEAKTGKTHCHQKPKKKKKLSAEDPDVEPIWVEVPADPNAKSQPSPFNSWAH